MSYRAVTLTRPNQSNKIGCFPQQGVKPNTSIFHPSDNRLSFPSEGTGPSLGRNQNFKVTGKAQKKAQISHEIIVSLLTLFMILAVLNYIGKRSPEIIQVVIQAHFKTLKVKVKSLSRVGLFATPWTVAYQAPLSMRLSRQEYWSGSPFPSPGYLPDPGIEPGSPALESDTLTSEPQGKPL